MKLQKLRRIVTNFEREKTFYGIGITKWALKFEMEVSEGDVIWKGCCCHMGTIWAFELAGKSALQASKIQASVWCRGQ